MAQQEEPKAKNEDILAEQEAREPERRAQRPRPRRNPVSGCLWELIRMVVYASLPFALIAILVLLGVTTLGNVFSGLREIFQGAPGPVRVIPSPTLLLNIQELGQFVTLSAEFANPSVVVRSERQGTFLRCAFTADHVVTGTIEAGVDLSQLTADDIRFNEETSTYTITLPPANITSCRVDDIIQKDERQSFCNVSFDEVRRLAQHIAELGFLEKAAEEQVIPRAEAEARDGISAFVGVLTGAQVNVEFSQPEVAAALPASCETQPPAGWVQDPRSGLWLRADEN